MRRQSRRAIPRGSPSIPIDYCPYLLRVVHNCHTLLLSGNAPDLHIAKGPGMDIEHVQRFEALESLVRQLKLVAETLHERGKAIEDKLMPQALDADAFRIWNEHERAKVAHEIETPEPLKPEGSDA